MQNAALSHFDGLATHVSTDEVKAMDWLPGTVEQLYAAGGGSLEELTRQVAVKEHVARKAGVHPSAVRVSADGTSATCPGPSCAEYRVVVRQEGNRVIVSDAEPVA